MIPSEVRHHLVTKVGVSYELAGISRKEKATGESRLRVSLTLQTVSGKLD